MHSDLKKDLLFGLVKSLREYFPDSLILVNEGFLLEERTQKIIDYGIVDKFYDNNPHGKREALAVLECLDFLKRNGVEWVHKMCYDTIIYRSNVSSFDNIESKAVNGIEFVSCKWRVAKHTNLNENAIGTWMWYGKVDFAQRVISTPSQNVIEAERTLFNSIKQNNLLDKVFLFEHADEMLNHTWLTHGDIINDAGKTVLNPIYR